MVERTWTRKYKNARTKFFVSFIGHIIYFNQIDCNKNFRPIFHPAFADSIKRPELSILFWRLTTEESFVQLETRETHAIDSAVSIDLYDSELKLECFVK